MCGRIRAKWDRPENAEDTRETWTAALLRWYDCTNSFSADMTVAGVVTSCISAGIGTGISILSLGSRGGAAIQRTYGRRVRPESLLSFRHFR